MVTRKLVKLGKSSVVVSLPKDWLKEVNLEPGDEVLLKKEFDGSLRIMPVKDRKKLLVPEIEINIDECSVPGLLEKILQGSYITGREKVIITTSTGFKGNQFKEIRQIIERIRGVEVLEQSINRIELKTFVDPTKFKLSLLLKRALSLLVSMLEYFLKGLMDKEEDLITEISYMYDEVHRIFLTMARQLIVCQIQRDFLDITELENPLQILESRVIINNLNGIGFELNSLATYTKKILKNIKIDNEIVKETLTNIISEIIRDLQGWFDAYVKKDILALNNILNRLLQNQDTYEELLDKICLEEIEIETRKFVKRAFNTFLFIKHLMKDIIESSINILIIKPPLNCAIIRTKTAANNIFRSPRESEK